MDIRSLLHEGKLGESIEFALTSLRERPEELQTRTSLFELFCFAGEWDRAQKQLNILASGTSTQQMGAMFYHHVLAATRVREDSFGTPVEATPANGSTEPMNPGTLDGEPFQSFQDSDPRVGNDFELIVGADYLRIPLAYIARVQVEQPRRLRDLIWAPATITTRESFAGQPLKEVLIPVLAPGSWRSTDDAVRLGRTTVLESDPAGQLVPMGQRMFLVDDSEVALLAMRQIEFATVTD